MGRKGIKKGLKEEWEGRFYVYIRVSSILYPI